MLKHMRLKIASKITIGFMIVLVLTAFIGYTGYKNMKSINDGMTIIYQDRLVPITYLNEVNANLLKIRGDLLEMTNNPTGKQGIIEQITQEKALIEEYLKKYGETELTTEESQLFTKLQNDGGLYYQQVEEYEKLNTSAEMLTHLAGLKEQRKYVMDDIEALIKLNQKLADEINSNADVLYAKSVKSMLICIILSIIFGLCIAILITLIITRPVKQLQGLMGKAGNGDLTVKSEINTGDEIEALGASFNQMITHQSAIIKQVRNSAQELAASSEEMAASAEQVSSATQQISGNMQEVAKDTEVQDNAVIDVSQALVQLASLVQLAQNRALAANDGSVITMNTANDGRKKVKETVEAMDIINQKSNDTAIVVQELNRLSTEIGNIVNTINAIAAQTDLLALNAAIEAARAGEHGRGFAVVADEVRKLSEGSHQGAEEIAALVSEMVKHAEKAVEAMKFGSQAVENGVKVVNETDQVFAEIISAVEHTVKNIEEIVDVTKDEVATSDQIVNLINTVASITEKTVSSIQEVSAAAEEQTATIETLTAVSEEVSALAVSSEELVERFKVNEDK